MSDTHQQRLRVWWIPQIPMKPFLVDIESVEEGVKIMHVLARYDLFQHENNVKPDYSNAGGILYFDEETSEWEDWEIEVDGKWFFDPEEYVEYMKGNKP